MCTAIYAPCKMIRSNFMGSELVHFNSTNSIPYKYYYSSYRKTKMKYFLLFLFLLYKQFLPKWIHNFFLIRLPKQHYYLFHLLYFYVKSEIFVWPNAKLCRAIFAITVSRFHPDSTILSLFTMAQLFLRTTEIKYNNHDNLNQRKILKALGVNVMSK